MCIRDSNLLGHHCFLFLVTFFVVNVLFLHHSYPQNSSFLSFMYLGCGRLNLWNWISKFYIWHFIIHLFIHFLAINHTFMGKSGTDRQQTNSNFINIDSITFPVFRLEQGGTVVSIFNWEQFNKDAVSLFTMCRQISPLNRNLCCYWSECSGGITWPLNSVRYTRCYISCCSSFFDDCQAIIDV